MTILLTSDLHFSDNPLEEYRWNIFNTIRDLINQYKVEGLYILGDLTDRKDRHSGSLTNRLINELAKLPVRPFILKGNHDEPLTGVPFWKLLNATDAAVFITEPCAEGQCFWLPYEKDPAAAWRDIDFSGIHTVFMHQTISGAVGNNGYKIEGDKVPILSRRLKIYSGDIHTPQRIGGIEYVGSPYPIKFGDDYKTRMLLLNNDMSIKREIIITNNIRRAVLTIGNMNELAHAELRRGDQVRIHYKLALDDVKLWPGIRDQIREWAINHDILLVSIDTIVEFGSGKRQRRSVESTHDPLTVFRAFSEAEQLSGDIVRSGLEMLREAGHAED